MKHIFVATLVVICAGAASAQDQISPEAFLDRVTGRTATFVNFSTRNLVGVEQFLSRDQSKWAAADGSCTYGTLSIEGPALCFLYDDSPNSPHCWVPYVQGEKLFVMLWEGTEIQEVSEINDIPVACFDTPLS